MKHLNRIAMEAKEQGLQLSPLFIGMSTYVNGSVNNVKAYNKALQLIEVLWEYEHSRDGDLFTRIKLNNGTIMDTAHGDPALGILTDSEGNILIEYAKYPSEDEDEAEMGEVRLEDIRKLTLYNN